MQVYLEFEKQIADLDGKIRELQTLAEEDGSVDLSDDIARLHSKSETALVDLYRKLDAWQ